MKTPVLCAALCAGLLSLSTGTVRADAKGVTGAVCNPANASDLDFFRTRPTGITNNGMVDKYISCSFPTDVEALSSNNFFYFSFKAGSSAGQAQCVAMRGSSYGNSIQMYSLPPVNMAAGATSSIAFTDIPGVTSYYPLSVSCRLTAGVELGLIWLEEYDPTQ